ncbi:hypothetical protein MAPG_09583, partial [Magnaporthiopsis poae ATCC 64411]
MAPMAWLSLALAALLVVAVQGAAPTSTSYLYGAPIGVECLNRSSETGEHIELANHELQWIPFPTCNETDKPLEFGYGVETELNCTIAMITD